jgi:5-carboxymethyl-2-hydroxymuconate isomerase
MPHIIVEYTDNLADAADMPALLRTLNKAARGIKDEQGKQVYQTGAIRSRAIKLTEWSVADGEDDYAFVHVTVKIAGGRSDAVEKETAHALFEVVKAHFAALYEKRYLALSLELFKFEQDTLKHNNIHAKFKTKMPA